jgi:transcriptional regulator with XRE-family HTH domain
VNHDELKYRALQKPEVRAAYEELGPEFEVLRQMLLARKAAGLTQAQVAQRMGTKPPAVTRLESSLGSGKHSPSLATLRKYAAEVGCELELRLVDKGRPNKEMEPTR